MKGVKLTLQEKEGLQIKKFDGVTFYNPILDNNNEYFISQEEVEQTTNPDTLWVKDLELVNIELKTREILS